MSAPHRFGIRHTTTFEYTRPVSSLVMEARLQPRSDSTQRCSWFLLSTTPGTEVSSYVDPLGNVVHYFDLPERHDRLVLATSARVERRPPSALPEALAAADWKELERLARSHRNWDYTQQSRLTQPSERLDAFVAELGLRRREDPLSTLRALNHALHVALPFHDGATSVDSSVDECLEKRRGVCQDLTHVFLAIGRRLGFPCRYVSGYLFDPTLPAGDVVRAPAGHAWAEAELPDLGWIGFDPTHGIVAGAEHLRVAVGRDYADVPPTRGVFQGPAESRLSVEVEIRRMADDDHDGTWQFIALAAETPT